MNYIRSLLLSVLLACLSFPGNGQGKREEPPPMRERIFFAGNMGFQFGTYTNIQIAPAIGIWLLPRLNLAAGPNYQFYKDPFFGKTDIIGYRTYSQLFLIRDLNNIIPVGTGLGIYTHIEYEGLSLKKDFWRIPYNEPGRFMIHSALAGFGISQMVGRRSAMTFTLLWVLTNDEYAIYGNPEIRIGFLF